MNNFYRTNKWTCFVSGIIIAIIYISLSSTAVDAQDKTPPKPKEPSTILRMPKPVRAGEITGRATLPEELPHGFSLDVAEKVLTGNWDVKGKVTAVEKRTIIFKTDKGETGHLVYRLPKGLKSVIRSEQQISIKRRVDGYGSSFGYLLNVSSDNNLIISSARIFGDKPREVMIAKDVVLQQGKDESVQAIKSKYETINKVPVVLVVNGEIVKLSAGEPAEVSIMGGKYLLLVTESSETRPAKEYESMAEGKGFTLEYALTLK